MHFNQYRIIYEALPIHIKRLAGWIPKSWIFGKSYRQTLKRGKYFENATRDEILAFQANKLNEVLEFVTDQVPAYKSLRSVVSRFDSLDALNDFPVIEKEHLQENIQMYLPRDFNKIPHYPLTTGGTSGQQLKFYVDGNSQLVENAFQHRLWKRVGYSPSHRRATFRGVSFSNLKPGEYWQENPIYNEIQFSPFHMSEINLYKYVNKIRDYHPQFLYGYPSAIDMLAEFVLRNDLKSQMPKIKAALLISEGVNVGQRRRIEQAFNTRAFSFYGHSERVVMAGECEVNSTYHHFPDYGFLEIIDEDGNITQSPGHRGEIVGTGFLNRSLPLIRYRTGDYATRNEYHCNCGRCWDRFSDVEGHRNLDMLVGVNGARISTTALNMHGPMFRKVIRYQYSQKVKGKFELRLMVSPDFSEEDKQILYKAYIAKIGSELSLSIKTVEDIPLTARGKIKLVDSSLV
jgi:phenylacetate-CoA ligase